MSPQTRPEMVELTFDVPERLVGQFYIAVGAVLRRAQEEKAAPQVEPELREWGAESFDRERAYQSWRKFSPRAQAAFSLLMDSPGVAITADEIAAKVGLTNGRHSLAGLLAWPSRVCAELGMAAPFRVEAPGPPNSTASYWMDPQTAEMFVAARERTQAKQAEVRPQS